eukprot:scaffold1704_cov105-Cylindrotheca_fusiformis.AAC.5
MPSSRLQRLRSRHERLRHESIEKLEVSRQILGTQSPSDDITFSAGETSQAILSQNEKFGAEENDQLLAIAPLDKNTDISRSQQQRQRLEWMRILKKQASSAEEIEQLRKQLETVTADRDRLKRQLDTEIAEQQQIQQEELENIRLKVVKVERELATAQAAFRQQKHALVTGTEAHKILEVLNDLEVQDPESQRMLQELKEYLQQWTENGKPPKRRISTTKVEALTKETEVVIRNLQTLRAKLNETDDDDEEMIESLEEQIDLQLQLWSELERRMDQITNPEPATLLTESISANTVVDISTEPVSVRTEVDDSKKPTTTNAGADASPASMVANANCDGVDIDLHIDRIEDQLQEMRQIVSRHTKRRVKSDNGQTQESLQGSNDADRDDSGKKNWVSSFFPMTPEKQVPPDAAWINGVKLGVIEFSYDSSSSSSSSEDLYPASGMEMLGTIFEFATRSDDSHSSNSTCARSLGHDDDTDEFQMSIEDLMLDEGIFANNKLDTSDDQDNTKDNNSKVALGNSSDFEIASITGDESLRSSTPKLANRERISQCNSQNVRDWVNKVIERSASTSDSSGCEIESLYGEDTLRKDEGLETAAVFDWKRIRPKPKSKSTGTANSGDNGSSIGVMEHMNSLVTDTTGSVNSRYNVASTTGGATLEKQMEHVSEPVTVIQWTRPGVSPQSSTVRIEGNDGNSGKTANMSTTLQLGNVAIVSHKTANGDSNRAGTSKNDVFGSSEGDKKAVQSKPRTNSVDKDGNSNSSNVKSLLNGKRRNEPSGLDKEGSMSSAYEEASDEGENAKADQMEVDTTPVILIQWKRIGVKPQLSKASTLSSELLEKTVTDSKSTTEEQPHEMAADLSSRDFASNQVSFIRWERVSTRPKINSVAMSNNDDRCSSNACSGHKETTGGDRDVIIHWERIRSKPQINKNGHSSRNDYDSSMKKKEANGVVRDESVTSTYEVASDEGDGLHRGMLECDTESVSLVQKGITGSNKLITALNQELQSNGRDPHSDHSLLTKEGWVSIRVIDNCSLSGYDSFTDSHEFLDATHFRVSDSEASSDHAASRGLAYKTIDNLLQEMSGDEEDNTMYEDYNSVSEHERASVSSRKDGDVEKHAKDLDDVEASVSDDRLHSPKTQRGSIESNASSENLLSQSQTELMKAMISAYGSSSEGSSIAGSCISAEGRGSEFNRSEDNQHDMSGFMNVVAVSPGRDASCNDPSPVATDMASPSGVLSEQNSLDNRSLDGGNDDKLGAIGGAQVGTGAVLTGEAKATAESLPEEPDLGQSMAKDDDSRCKVGLSASDTAERTASEKEDNAAETTAGSRHWFSFGKRRRKSSSVPRDQENAQPEEVFPMKKLDTTNNIQKSSESEPRSVGRGSVEHLEESVSEEQKVEEPESSVTVIQNSEPQDEFSDATATCEDTRDQEQTLQAAESGDSSEFAGDEMVKGSAGNSSGRLKWLFGRKSKKREPTSAEELDMKKETTSTALEVSGSNQISPPETAVEEKDTNHVLPKETEGFREPLEVAAELDNTAESPEKFATEVPDVNVDGIEIENTTEKPSRPLKWLFGRRRRRSESGSGGEAKDNGSNENTEQIANEPEVSMDAFEGRYTKHEGRRGEGDMDNDDTAALRGDCVGTGGKDGSSQQCVDSGGVAPSELRIHITNESAGRSLDFVVPISTEVNLYETVYDNALVRKAGIRKWKKEIAKQVQDGEAEICCVLLDMDGKVAHTFSTDSLQCTTTMQLKELSATPYDTIHLVLRLRKLAGAIEREGESNPLSDLTIGITNESTGSSATFEIPITEDMNLYDGIYNNHEVLSAGVRQWPNDIAENLKSKSFEVLCALVSDQDNVAYSIDDLKDVSTKALAESTRRGEDPIHFILRYRKVELLQNEEDCHEAIPSPFTEHSGSLPKHLQIRLKNNLSGRSTDLLVSVEEESSLFDTVYENDEVLSCGIRKWPKDVAQAVKSGTHEIVCVLLDQAGQHTHVFSMEDLKATSTRRLAFLASGAQDTVSLLLQFREIGGDTCGKARDHNPASTMKIHISNESSGTSKFLDVPIEKDLSVFDSIYDSKVLAESNVRKFPSEVLEGIKKNTHEIKCVLFDTNMEESRLFSIEDLVSTSTKDLFELALKSKDPIRLVFRAQRKNAELVHPPIRNLLQRANYKSLTFIRLQITNEATERVKALVLPVSPELNLYDAMYSDDASNSSYISDMPEDIAQALKEKKLEVKCLLLDEDGVSKRAFSLDALKRTTTSDIQELTEEGEGVVSFVLRCYSAIE